MSLALVAATVSLGFAQFDDVYYDPDARGGSYRDNGYASGDNYYSRDYDNGYDDETYNDLEDYDYYYASRIRRFHRPTLGFGFYDPFLVDMYYYDPFYSGYYYPGTSIYINLGGYNDYWGWRRWHRWRNWNSYFYWSNPVTRYYTYLDWCGPGYSPWGWNSYNAYNYYGGWNAGFGNWGYSNYWNNYYYANCPLGGGYYNGGYYGNGHYTGGNNGNNHGGYYGPRQTGTVTTSPRGPVKTDLTTPRASDPVLTEIGKTEEPRPSNTTVPRNPDVPKVTPQDRVYVPNDAGSGNNGPREVTPQDAPRTEDPVYQPRQEPRPSRTEDVRPGYVPNTDKPSRSEERARSRDRSDSYSPPSQPQREERRSYEPPPRSYNPPPSSPPRSYSPSPSTPRSSGSSGGSRMSSPSPSRSSGGSAPSSRSSGGSSSPRKN